VNGEVVVARLRAAGCIAADDEAACMLATTRDPDTLEGWLRRRADGEPLPWITGWTTFCGARLRVTPGVYVPRQQTETLARRAARVLPRAGVALDLCTGAGAVAAHLRRVVPDARVMGIDVDPRAARCAHDNGVTVLVGDLAAAVHLPEVVDVVTAVAPYVPTGALPLLPADVRRHEPIAALDGGPDGLDVVRRVVEAAARVLRPGGWLLVEVGGEQDAGLEREIAARGFDAVTAWRDTDGDLRGMAARRA
jgi:release factor glutamine methyltransferase